MTTPATFAPTASAAGESHGVRTSRAVSAAAETGPEASVAERVASAGRTVDMAAGALFSDACALGRSRAATAADWMGVLAGCATAKARIEATQTLALAHTAAIDVVDSGSDDGSSVEQHRGLGHVRFDAPELVAPTLGLTSSGAESKVRQAVSLVTRTPRVVLAMSEGRGDAYRAGIIADELADAPPADARAVVTALGDRFGMEAGGRLRARVRRELNKINPDLVRHQCLKARSNMGLRRWVNGDGTDTWQVDAPTESSRAAYAAVNDLALKVKKDTGVNISAARAAAMFQLILGHSTGSYQVHVGIPMSVLAEAAATVAADVVGDSARDCELVEVTGMGATGSTFVPRAWLADLLDGTLEHSLHPEAVRDPAMPGVGRAEHSGAGYDETVADLSGPREPTRDEPPDPTTAELREATAAAESEPTPGERPEPTTAELKEATAAAESEPTPDERPEPTTAEQSELTGGEPPEGTPAERREPSAAAPGEPAPQDQRVAGRTADRSLGPESSATIGAPVPNSAARSAMEPPTKAGVVTAEKDGVGCDDETGGYATGRLDPKATRRHHGWLTTRYHPTKAIRAAVIARDGYCRFPGCAATARLCDLDHVNPWPAGPTTPSNLVLLCRRHHRVKQRRGWRVRLDLDGILTWTDPLGRLFATEPFDHLAVAVRAGPATQPASPAVHRTSLDSEPECRAGHRHSPVHPSSSALEQGIADHRDSFDPETDRLDEVIAGLTARSAHTWTAVAGTDLEMHVVSFAECPITWEFSGARDASDAGPTIKGRARSVGAPTVEPPDRAPEGNGHATGSGDSTSWAEAAFAEGDEPPF